MGTKMLEDEPAPATPPLPPFTPSLLGPITEPAEGVGMQIELTESPDNVPEQVIVPPATCPHRISSACADSSQGSSSDNLRKKLFTPVMTETQGLRSSRCPSSSGIGLGFDLSRSRVRTYVEARRLVEIDAVRAAKPDRLGMGAAGERGYVSTPVGAGHVGRTCQIGKRPSGRGTVSERG